MNDKITGKQLAQAMESYLYVGDSSIYNTGDSCDDEWEIDTMHGDVVLAIVKHLLSQLTDGIRKIDNIVISDDLQNVIDIAIKEREFDYDDEE